MITDREIAGRFNAGPGRRARTLLVGGAPEPMYLPGCARRPALIRYTRNYAQSALHEIAHWCLASPAKRAKEDYGLWYQPPPRSGEDQARFYAAEVPVQALEMLLARVCGLGFHFSADNPGADGGSARQAFEASVVRRFETLCEAAPGTGLAHDTQQVLQALDPDWTRCLTLPGRAGTGAG